MFNKLLIGVLSFGFVVNAQAQLLPIITPSAAEVNQYLSASQLINSVASECLDFTWNTHVDFFNKYGVSKYYGDRHPLWSIRAERLKVVRNVGAPDSIVDLQEPISCIGLTRRCLKQGFYATQNDLMKKLWDKIDKKVLDNGTQGDVLINNLKTLGWKVMYWNPDPTQNVKWDAEDKVLLPGNTVVTWDSGQKNSKGQFIFHPGWGYHQARYSQVMKSNKYYNIMVDDKVTLVGNKKTIPQKFLSIPFFVAIAHTGYHVFSGAFGEVIEGHSMRALDSIDNLQKSMFNPLAPGGGPRWSNSEHYRSGVIAVPPNSI